MIVKAEGKDISAVAALAAALWPHHLPGSWRQNLPRCWGRRKRQYF